MVIKNTIKDYLFILIWSGVLFGLFIGAVSRSFTFGIVAALFFGVFFTFGIAVFSSSIENKAKGLSEEISKIRNIICEGPANYKKNANSVGGWLFFSEDALEFYPHKFNFGGKCIAILIDDIDDIISIDTILKKQLIIKSKTEDYTFIVSKANLWKEIITKTI